MRFRLLVLVLVLGSLVLSGAWLARGAAGTSTVSSSCPSVMLLASRGSGDKIAKDQGIGRPEVALKNALAKRVPDLETWANPYSAVGVFSWDWNEIANGAGAITQTSGLGLGAYHDSVVQGKTLLAQRLRQALRDCAGQTKFVLAGYSQGAQVTADVYQHTLNQAERAKIAAVVLFGDPYFNGGDRGADRGSFSGRRDGLLGKRTEFDAPRTLVLSYCHSHDPICQGFFFRVGPTRTPDPGSLTTSQHKNYTKFGEPEDAAKQVGDKIGVPTAGNAKLLVKASTTGWAQIGGWRYPPGNTFTTVQKVFGMPSECSGAAGGVVASWKSPRLTGFFYTLASPGGSPTGCAKGSGLYISWLTCSDPRCVWEKLRVGDSATRAKALYPNAHREQVGDGDERLWLVTGRSVIDENIYPILSALLNASTGTVANFQLKLNLGGE